MTIEQKLNKELSHLFAGSAKGVRAGRKVTYEQMLSDKMLMISVIRKGVPYSLFALIKDVTPFSESDWAHLLDLSAKSLSRYKQASKHFRPLQSEKIIEMAEVTRAGVETFGSMEKFRLWLETPNFALGNLRPLDLLKDSYGKEMVLGELVRIEHGIFA